MRGKGALKERMEGKKRNENSNDGKLHDTWTKNELKKKVRCEEMMERRMQEKGKGQKERRETKQKWSK